MDKIVCLGKNYSDHIQEMKEAAPEMPVIFLKPPSVLKEIKNNTSIVLPWDRGVIHHELEIVFKLYKKNIIGLGVGLDLTLRETQKKLKEMGHPWEISKVFKNSYNESESLYKKENSRLQDRSQKRSYLCNQQEEPQVQAETGIIRKK